MEPISLAVGGILMLLGIVVGRLGRRRVKALSPPQAICGCDHGLNMHDEHVCDCQKYVGPRPIEEFFSTPTLPPGEGGV